MTNANEASTPQTMEQAPLHSAEILTSDGQSIVLKLFSEHGSSFIQVFRNGTVVQRPLSTMGELSAINLDIALSTLTASMHSFHRHSRGDLNPRSLLLLAEVLSNWLNYSPLLKSSCKSTTPSSSKSPTDTPTATTLYAKPSKSLFLTPTIRSRSRGASRKAKSRGET